MPTTETQSHLPLSNVMHSETSSTYFITSFEQWWR